MVRISNRIRRNLPYYVDRGLDIIRPFCICLGLAAPLIALFGFFVCFIWLPSYLLWGPSSYDMSAPAGVSWVHACNSQACLRSTLSSTSDVTYIEADVIVGPSAASQPGIGDLLMGHPPATGSDLSFRDFIVAIGAANTEGGRGIKGVKIDFKDPRAVNPALRLLGDVPAGSLGAYSHRLPTNVADVRLELQSQCTL
jgi:hypothetical protein